MVQRQTFDWKKLSPKHLIVMVLFLVIIGGGAFALYWYVLKDNAINNNLIDSGVYTYTDMPTGGEDAPHSNGITVSWLTGTIGAGTVTIGANGAIGVSIQSTVNSTAKTINVQQQSGIRYIKKGNDFTIQQKVGAAWVTYQEVVTNAITAYGVAGVDNCLISFTGSYKRNLDEIRITVRFVNTELPTQSADATYIFKKITTA